MSSYRSGLWVVAALAVGACKSRGTIDVAFEGLDGGCTGDARGDASSVDGARYSIVYAQPNVMCADCACGACFGDEGGVDGCPDGTCGPQATNVSLDLSPGEWAVILRVFEGAGAVAEGCVEVHVDSDGVSSARADAGLHCPMCP
jgi:hypothetical protein